LLTLQITGLTNGEQVLIQRFLDGNANTNVDTGEPLVDAFRISDGGVSIIGGVTNLNVPYDHDPASGTISTTLSFAVNIENIVGQQLFRLVSPAGRFPAVIANLVVTNAGLAQSVSGVVFNGPSPVPYAVVVALSQPNNNYRAGVIAD